ncbi:hypothetical protein [Streptomyces glaucescens]|uniref:Uncharacterized protein n=1 Tax=Streptomyces glaucescens TaxID=1907 RepID=A0A089XDY0_STRGA|nr:hypothetical protein [Streptomyces glaucescens]AIS02213.1 hypothetical protein SGLAU_31395 [Streptomyces glaucescens]
MSDEVFLQTLFDDVCQTLSRAGFDIASASAEEGAGLRVRKESGAVIVGWVPADQLDPAGRMDAEYEGIRTALRQALLEILTQAGFAVQADRSSGEVRVEPA